MLTAVPGILVGHWTDTDAGTGCTVIIPPEGTVGGVDVRGGGPGTRETDLLSPVATVPTVSAVLLSGGSAFGLAAASGVVEWCEEHGLGVDTGIALVPIVPAAVIYDLGITGNARRPGHAEGRLAAEAATGGPHAVGSVGAGTGATLGKANGQDGWCKGGLGAAHFRLLDGTAVGVLVVVNAFGDVLDEQGGILAGAWRDGRGFIDARRALVEEEPVLPRLGAMGNTTLAVVATDARLGKAEATHVARMAQAGLARVIAPYNTPLDGDTVFCLATGQTRANPIIVGAAAAEAAVLAVRDAVRSASSVRGVPTAAMRRAAASTSD